VSSREHPFQTFQWADYAALPGKTYTYRVLRAEGHGADRHGGRARRRRSRSPPRPRPAAPTRSTSTAARSPHRPTPRLPQHATSKFPTDTQARRGLQVPLARPGGGDARVHRARDGKDFELHGAIYEFQWQPVLRRLGAAAATKAKVTVIYDDTQSDRGAPVRADLSCLQL